MLRLVFRLLLKLLLRLLLRLLGLKAHNRLLCLNAPLTHGRGCGRLG